MRNRKKLSFNGPSFNIDQLPIKRIVLLALLSYILIFIEASLLTSYRMLTLPHALAFFCSDAADIFVPCVNEVIKIMLYGGEWSAVKFSIYVATLTPLFYLLMVRQKGSPASNMLVLTLFLLVAIAATMQPSWVELASVLMSSLLAGCFIKKRRDNLKLG